MSKGLAQFHEELRRIRPFLNKINWKDSTLFVDTDSKYVVAVMIRAPSVIIVSLRGTRPLYISDWMIDFRASKTSVSVGSGIEEVRLHTGFFLAIADCMGRIGAAIQARTPDFSIPVCIVGHSLGGAMAAIAFALDGVAFFSRFRSGIDTTVKLGARASYSYGMPRYGDAYATQRLRSPTHIYNSRDLVPVVPPRWAGFANVSDEYRADAPETLLPRAQDRDSPGLRGVRHHLIERYILHLGRLAGAPD